MSDANMIPEPVYIAAECDVNCDDPCCPYYHIGGWYLDGRGPYNSAQDALDAEMPKE